MDTMHTRQKPTLTKYHTTLFTVLWLVISAFISVQSIGQIPEGILTVRPVEIDDVLINPGIGFSTFQMFNGDNHQANQDVLRIADLERYQNDKNDLENIHHPATSLAYFRILWSVIEPRQEVYQWEYIDELLKLARLHGQKLMLRISPYKGKAIDDVPAWYRELVGDERNFPHIKWPVDPENPLYAEYFGKMIRELGKRYDGHPDLEAVDVSFVGWAGEGGGTKLLST
ncbi:MAG: beta-galactosidase, partial [Bacteroidales bacterium]|nr:beta-galactosidase [Bacteroidales bacterium]